MFAMILRSHWMWTRTLVSGVAFIAFILPAAVWRLSGGGDGFTSTARLLDNMTLMGPLLSFIALFGAFVLAVYPWTIDAETNHVYPLSLPVSWPRYLGMRFLAGSLTLLLPALALYLGSLLVVSLIELTPLLRAYPGALAVRFLLALLVAYALSFALQYLAGRRATLVALLLLLGTLGLFAALEILGQKELGDAIGRFLFEWPGPLGVFTQSWVLIDV